MNSLYCKSTGWCTAGKATAKEQLKGGDFHVYYNTNAYGDITQPRIAIRMEGSQIAEIRGIGKNQNLDEAISDSGILEKKLENFGSEGLVYLKKAADMKRVTAIEKAVKSSRLQKTVVDLSADDLKFLYDLDEFIFGFGYGKAPRVAEILSSRNRIEDLNVIFRHFPNFQGDLNLNFLMSAKGLKLPENFNGKLFLNSLENAEGLILPNGYSNEIRARKN